MSCAGIWRETSYRDWGDFSFCVEKDGVRYTDINDKDEGWLAGTPDLVLDESPEAIESALEMRDEAMAQALRRSIENEERLTAALAKVTAQRDKLLSEAKAMLGDLTGKYGINEYVCAKAHVHPYNYREQGLTEAIAACEQGE